MTRGPLLALLQYTAARVCCVVAGPALVSPLLSQRARYATLVTVAEDIVVSTRRWPKQPAEELSSSRSGDALAVWARRARRRWKQYRSCAIRGSKPFHEGERPWEKELVVLLSGRRGFVSVKTHQG